MKTKLYFIAIFLFAGIYAIQAQIKGEVKFDRKEIKVVKEDGFDRFFSTENFYIEEPGSPALPVLLKSYLIPVDADNVTVNIQNLSKQKEAGQFIVYPAQPPVSVGAINSVFIPPNRKIYDSETLFPNKSAEIFSDEFYLGYRIVTVRLYPIEYNPKAKELYVCDFNFTIDYSVNTKKAVNNELIMQAQSLYRYELNKKNVKFRVENPDAVDSYDTKVQKVIQGNTIVYDFSVNSNETTGLLRSQTVSVVNERIPEYIIITNNALKSSFQALADWKTKKGIFTVIVTTEEISANYSGSDLQEKIRNYLIDAKRKWGAGLFVLLGGDINIIPARMIKGSADALSYPADRYYYTSDPWSIYQGNIFSNSISALSIINILGRIPVSNAQEGTVYTNKIIAYEKANGLGDLNYLKNNLYADAYIQVNDNGTLSDFAITNIKGYVKDYVPSWINNKYICDNANCSGSVTRYSTMSSDCTSGHSNGDIELNRDNFLSCLNTGASLGVGKFHFIYQMEHGSAVGAGTSGKDKGQSINRSDLDNLTNGTSYQIWLSSLCNTANFAYDCFGKHYIMKQNGGGVAYIGNTDVGNSDEHDQLQYFLDALYTTTNHPSLGRYDVGSAFQNILRKNYINDWRLHLLGDPEMQVWTNVPQTMTVTTSPSSLQVGQNSINVTVSNLSLLTGESALICVQKGTEVYETKKIGANGTYTIPCTIGTSGTVNVTVTAHNYFPVEKTVSVATNTAPIPIISSVNFIDNGTNGSIGNSNGQNDAGETIRLQVALKNNGGGTANNLTATLSKTSSYITILNNSFAVGSIAANGTATAEFLYKIDKDTPEMLSNTSNAVQFKLDIKDASNTVWTRTFNIDVFASDLQQRNKIITATASPVQFNIELQNIGQAPATGLTATLKANNAVSVSRSYPTIGKLETKTATSAFQFTIPSGYTYQNTPLRLEVTNAYGKTWAFDFTLAKPANISGLDFISGVNNITLTWNALAGATGYNIYRCNAGANDVESGSYTKLNTTPVSLRYFDDQSNLPALTKYFYKAAAVSSTGAV
ncbi:MAG: C25 family cysteine peptidase [Candidatus Azobacteroides sp.]|nr:C25 family cysteine peptidase [Candidatus Azobacteroides sp.]